MLIDGLFVTDDSPIQRKIVNEAQRGIAFPPTPADGDVFELTQTYQGNSPGIYFYVLSDVAWIVKYPNNDVMPYDVSGATFGNMNDGDTISRHMSVRSYRLKEAFSGCVAEAITAATVDTSISIFIVSRSGAENEVGTLFFEAAETIGVFSQVGSGDMLVTAGEKLVLRAPTPVDQDLSELSFTFAGSLL